MRLRSQIAALCLAALATPLSARPFTADDLLAAEEFRQIAFSPDGRHLVFERLAGQAASGPFDQDVATGYRRGRVYVVDLTESGPALPLLPAVEGEGQIAGPFSPDGTRMVVLRFRRGLFEAGVVELASGEVRWLGVTPELGWLGQTIAWRSDRELIMATRPWGDLPLRLRIGVDQRQALPELWSATADGKAAAVRVVGSGRFLNDREDEASGALVQLDVVTGKTRTLAQGEFYDLELSPDGRQVAAMQRLENIQASAEERLYVASDFRRRNLVLVDLMSRAIETPCPACHLATHLIAWSEDGREVLVYGRRTRETAAAPGYLRLSKAAAPAAAQLGDLVPVIDRTSEGYEIPRAAWLHNTPIVLARPRGGGRADWWTASPAGLRNLTAALPGASSPLAGRDSQGPVVLSGAAAWRIFPDRGPVRLFPAAAVLPRQGLGLSSRLRLNAPADPSWTQTAPATDVYIHSSRGHRFNLMAGAPQAVAVSPVGAALVERNPDGPLSLSIRTENGGKRAVLTLNQPFLAIDFARHRMLEAQAPDGASLRHVLLLPPTPPTGRKPALVVVVYPGRTYDRPPPPYGQGVGRFSVNSEILASAGYAVLLPSLPRGADQEPGQGLAAQILAAVDQAAATGLVDAQRLVVMGQSFGGYASLMAAAQSKRFKAVIASAAPTNLASGYADFDPQLEISPRDGLNLNSNYGWAEMGQGNLKATPWEAPETYQRNSPFYLADRITAPVLLIHGDADFIRLGQAQQMFSALYRAGKDAELMTVFGEGHIISSPANLREVYRRMLDWLEKTLAPPAP